MVSTSKTLYRLFYRHNSASEEANWKKWPCIILQSFQSGAMDLGTSIGACSSCYSVPLR